MKKKLVLLIIFVCVSSLAMNSQIKNTFIQKGGFIVSPTFERGYVENLNIDVYGFGGELAYMPLNRFEVRSGVKCFFGTSQGFLMSFSSRYYLLKTKFTIFPEVYTSFALTSDYIDYGLAMGISYDGIFKRIGIDLIARYNPKMNYCFPDSRISILLGKIEKE